jgi:AcrR family transcriptional regulator
MARQINYEKLKAVKESTMALVAEQGTQKATISEVAKHAGVSAGYLYTHFESKEALINQLIHETYDEIYEMLIANSKRPASIKDKIRGFIKEFMGMAQREPVKAKFLISLAHDERFIKEFIMEDPHGVFEIAEKVLSIGKEEGFIRKELTAEELLLVMLNLPISSMYYCFIAQSFTLDEVDMSERIARLCLKAVE